jgi:[ribosomal protein S5]-alanine N-acetyltransferase
MVVLIRLFNLGKVMILNTVQLFLKKVTEKNGEDLYPYLSDPQLYEYLEDPIPTLAETVDNFRFASLEKSPNNDEMIWLKWTVNDTSSQCIGIVEIGLFDDEYAEIGFMTFSDFQNKGYASIYCSLALNEAKKRFKSFKLHASVNHQNLASCRVIEKTGFELCKINKNAKFVKGQWSDELIYRLII